MQDIPNLMPFQLDPFNGDTFIQAEFLKLKEMFNIKTAVELGTCLGSSAIWMAKHFDNVITIEINKKFADIAEERINRDDIKNIQLIVGDTIKVLPEIIKAIPNESIFFTDSHWYNHCPMQDELSIIAKSGLKPVIAIHDFKVPEESALGYDSYNGQDFTFEWIKPRLDEIYGTDGYEYYYNSDAASTSIKRGIIYITPKQ